MANLTPSLIVVAGGRSRRMQGVAKALLRHRGSTLLEHALGAAPQACHRVVVGAADLGVPHDCALVREDPPFGGPVAGIAAGLAELSRIGCTAAWVLVSACDHPYARPAGRLLADLLPRYADHDTIDAVIPTDSSGQRQSLFAFYRRRALTDAVAALPTPRDASVRRLVAGLEYASPVLPDGLLDDVDDVDTAVRIGLAPPAQNPGLPR